MRRVVAAAAVAAATLGVGPAVAHAGVSNCTWTVSGDHRTATVRCTTTPAWIYRADITCYRITTGDKLVLFGPWEAYRNPSGRTCPYGWLVFDRKVDTN